MRRTFGLITFLGACLLLLPALMPAEEAGMSPAPRLQVSLAPASGYIPAVTRKPGPVYQFRVTAFDAERRVIASGQKLVQAGERQSLTGGRDSTGLVLGAVAIERGGRAAYRAQFIRNGRVLLETSADVVLLADGWK